MMEAPTPATHTAPYTILRIKRKRNEEPLDALVVEDKVRRKKSKGGVGVFQYAKTVESGEWDNLQSQQALQDAITKLSTENALREHAPAVAPSLHPARQGSPLAARRYTIIEVDQSMSPTKQIPDALPQNGVPKSNDPSPDFKMYDAVPSTPAPEKRGEEDPEMVEFQAMLSDYLRLNDVKLSPPSQTSPPTVKTSGMGESIHDSIPQPPSGDDDYVWDIFYHRPTSLSEWNDLANVGMLSTFPSSLFDENYDSESESEKEDEADEDSNEEDFYRNDYPDEESDASDYQGSSDEYHEHSDYDEDLGNVDEDEQFNF